MRSFIHQSTLAITWVAAFLTCHATGKGQTNPFLHQIGADGALRLVLDEPIKQPHFWWPRTLLNYHVVLNSSVSVPINWTLKNESTGEIVPIQVSDLQQKNGKLLSATLSFFADLPTGGHRLFLLNTVSAKPAPEAVPPKTETGSDIVLDTGELKIRIPSTQQMSDGKTVPGPIIAVNDGHGWVGESDVESPKRKVQRITTDVLDRGPLFTRVRVTYDFERGGQYVAKIKAVQGYDFVEFTESFSGLAKEDQACFHFLWTGLPLNQRRGTERIDEPHTIYYRGEDPHFTGPDHVEDPADEFYFRLGHSAADYTIQTSAVEFSDSNTGRAVGLCVLDGSTWDDGGYSIWTSSDVQAVRFRYLDQRLEWMLPLAGKSRQLAIAAFNTKDEVADAHDDHVIDRKDAVAAANNGSRIRFINSRYGGMGLDVVKEWQLSYPDSARRSPEATFPEAGKPSKGLSSLEAYSKATFGNTEPMRVEGNGLSPVSLRELRTWMVPGFCEFRDQMTPQLRAQITALLLFQSYVAAREEISPMRHMLQGHPNFMADWKYPLLAGAYLFPEHSMAHEWADQYEKFIELAGIFYVRPEVKPWEAQGGRWTESIAVYNWAFLGPATLANELGILFDGRDRLAQPGMALHGDYLSGIVTAPVKLGSDGEPFAFTPGTALLPENGFQRIHPPQGAHGGRRAIPNSVESFAKSLRNFAPLTAEHLLWIDRRLYTGTGIDQRKIAEGTDPGLKSSKFTGYGFILRSGVNTPDEISVYLQQVDKGPNYRWGFGNENGGGDIYYYAGGNSYSGHFGEDAGDRRVTDAEETSNTGVYKDSTFRGIGMNDLTEPLYDLGTAQFAEILARPGPDAYSWPEYQSRSVMLAGHDYIITYDAVNDMSRISWNTVKGQDKMPTILSIRGENSFVTTQTSILKSNVATESMRLEPYKGGGDRMTLVSHRTDIKLGRTRTDGPVAEVVLPESKDFIFQERAAFDFEEDGLSFQGRAGLIRKFKDGHTELNLFSGTKVGCKDLGLVVGNPALGISACFETPTDVSGRFFSRNGGRVTIEISADVPAGLQLYVNGSPAKVTTAEKTLETVLPPGAGRWQLTAGPVVPSAPEITGSVATADGALLNFSSVESATGYRIELSHDGGRTWTVAGNSIEPSFSITSLKTGDQVEVRVIALNGKTESPPATEYPVYVSDRPAGPPAGLQLRLAANHVVATWGQVLGAKNYVLYRRKPGEATWQELKRGADRSFIDSVDGVILAYTNPGLAEEALRAPHKTPVIYEYTVTSVDGIGESEKSSIASTDPASWRNWYPSGPLRYTRQSGYWLSPYVAPDAVPPAYYPEK